MNYMYLWLLLLPLAVYLFYFLQKRKDYFKQIGNKQTLGKLVNISELGVNVKNILFCLALLFIVLALLRPQWGLRNEKIERRGIDIVFVLDISQSMFSEDIQPSRLARSIYEINMLIKQLRGDRVGLVVFSGSATPVCPLTIDYGAVEMFLKTIKYYRESRPGTNLETAYSTAAALFDLKSAQSKVIMLFTDGESHEGSIDKIRSDAGAKGLLVAPIAVGTSAGQPIPVLDQDGQRQGYKKNKKDQIVISHLDLQTLKKIANIGPYVIDDSRSSILGILNDIKNLKKAKIKDTRIALYQERYQLFLLIGLILLLLSYF